MICLGQARSQAPHPVQRSGMSSGKPMEIDGQVLDAAEITQEELASRGVDLQDFIQTFFGEGYSGTLTMPDMVGLGSEAHMLG